MGGISDSPANLVFARLRIVWQFKRVVDSLSVFLPRYVIYYFHIYIG